MTLPEIPNIDEQKLWSKYEDITMHFNDLLMRLRSQSLAGIAAVSTLVGLFTKEGSPSLKMDWLAATGIFIALGFFWVAIWCLDFLYYNRLLIGAVDAIKSLEIDIGSRPIQNISLSTTIENEFKKCPIRRDISSTMGVLLFYAFVLIVIIAGAAFSYCKYTSTH